MSYNDKGNQGAAANFGYARAGVAYVNESKNGKGTYIKILLDGGEVLFAFENKKKDKEGSPDFYINKKEA